MQRSEFYKETVPRAWKTHPRDRQPRCSGWFYWSVFAILRHMRCVYAITICLISSQATKIRTSKFIPKILLHNRSIFSLRALLETTAAQPQKSLWEGKRPDVTVIAQIKSFDLIPITFTEMSPEWASIWCIGLEREPAAETTEQPRQANHKRIEAS